MIENNRVENEKKDITKVLDPKEKDWVIKNIKFQFLLQVSHVILLWGWGEGMWACGGWVNVGSQNSEKLSHNEKRKKGCPHPWTEYNNHCYLEGQTKVTWMGAKTECVSRCSHLVVIDSEEESEWLAVTFLRKGTCSLNVFSDCSAWTGGNDLNIEGQYGWNQSNVTMNFTYWHLNEPSVGYPELAVKRDCIDLLRSGKWNDRSCSFLNSFICEKSHVF
ncbi:CD209 antigen-like protein C [Saccostrea echinata]|uniref:CD209 antigen-like protein C n=1 Tax=Saccostrea echinata TaxID=191078 RepID=UPI002A7EEC84|nr:CD209 antigen-like protein C [Saccostrea echinata]